MKNKTIVLDVDGVVADLLPVWIHWYNADWGDNLDWKTINQWEMIPFVKPECGKYIYKYISNPNIYNAVKPIENSLRGVNELRKMGYRIIFVTSTPIGCSGRKFQWLNDNGFDVEIKDYVEALDKSVILSDYLVDDRDLNVITAQGQGIIFTAEYNKTLTGYPRVNNWQDVLEYFRAERIEEFVNG